MVRLVRAERRNASQSKAGRDGRGVPRFRMFGRCSVVISKAGQEEPVALRYLMAWPCLAPCVSSVLSKAGWSGQLTLSKCPEGLVEAGEAGSMGIHDVNQLDIIEAYRSGKSMSEIAFENECDFSIVRRVLEHFNIPRRRGDHVCPAYHQERQMVGRHHNRS